MKLCTSRTLQVFTTSADGDHHSEIPSQCTRPVALFGPRTVSLREEKRTPAECFLARNVDYELATTLAARESSRGVERNTLYWICRNICTSLSPPESALSCQHDAVRTETPLALPYTLTRTQRTETYPTPGNVPLSIRRGAAYRTQSRYTP